ncbi:hypothetical protein D3C72_1531280 [compost metagenome]
MVVLSRHRAQAAHLPEQPLHDFGTSPHIHRQELPAFLGQVLQNRARLEQGQRRAAIFRRLVDDGGNAVIRRDGEKLGLELLALADMHGNKVVGDARFFQEHRHFVPVGRGPVIQVDHRGLSR